MAFEKLNENSRAWVYLADRDLSDSEQELILKSGRNFIQNWAAHGAKLNADIGILHNRFLLILADEDDVKATGCSIDKSVHWVKAVGEELKVDFFNRLNIPLKSPEGEVQLKSLEELALEYDKGLIDDQSIVFNTLISNKKELENNFEIPLKDSWAYSRVMA